MPLTKNALGVLLLCPAWSCISPKDSPISSRPSTPCGTIDCPNDQKPSCLESRGNVSVECVQRNVSCSQRWSPVCGSAATVSCINADDYCKCSCAQRRAPPCGILGCSEGRKPSCLYSGVTMHGECIPKNESCSSRWKRVCGSNAAATCLNTDEYCKCECVYFKPSVG